MRLIVHPIDLPAHLPCSLWRAPLDQHVSAGSLSTLSTEEMARARRFVFERDRNRSIAARAALRQLLAQHTDQCGHALRLMQGAHGKPFMPEHPGVHFNVSHSQDTALIAISDSTELGVDLEIVRDMPDHQDLAAACFTAAECAALAALPHDRQVRAFFTCWTRKEACLKALGVGLHIEPRSFDVGISPTSRKVSIATGQGTAQLDLHSFDIGDEAVGAIAFDAARTSPGSAAAERRTLEAVQ